MPFNGVGVFQRLYNWTADQAAGIFVRNDRMDADTDDIALGLSNCITRDGQSAATANIPLGGFKLTGVGTGAAATDGVNFAQVFVAPSFTSGITVSGGITFSGGATGTGVISFAGATSVSVPTASVGDNSTKAASTAFATALAFAAALPAQSPGFLRSTGTVASFGTTHTGYAQKEVRGTDIVCAATIDLSSANGNYVHITGTTGPVTSFLIAAGAEYTIVWDAAATVTYNATSMIIQGGISRTVEIGEIWKVRGDSANNARITVAKQSGVAIAAYPYLYVREEQASGTQGGSSTGGTYHIRVLNTTVGTNTITGASLASNIVTLPTGTYEFEASAPCNSGNRHKLFLYNDTDATDILGGQNCNSGTAAGTSAICSGKFTLATTKNVKLRHYIETSTATNGLGGSLGLGSVEVYASLKLRKVA